MDRAAARCGGGAAARQLQKYPEDGGNGRNPARRVHRTASAASRRWRRTEGGEDQDVAALADASHELSQPRRSVVGDPSIFVMDGLYLCVLGGQRMCMTLSSPAELLARSFCCRAHSPRISITLPRTSRHPRSHPESCRAPLLRVHVRVPTARSCAPVRRVQQQHAGFAGQFFAYLDDRHGLGMLGHTLARRLCPRAAPIRSFEHASVPTQARRQPCPPGTEGQARRARSQGTEDGWPRTSTHAATSPVTTCARLPGVALERPSPGRRAGPPPAHPLTRFLVTEMAR